MNGFGEKSTEDTDEALEEVVITEFSDPLESQREKPKRESEYKRKKNQEQLEQLRREMMSQFQLTRQELAEAQEMERLQDEVKYLRKEKNTLQKQLSAKGGSDSNGSDPLENDNMIDSGSKKNKNLAFRQEIAVLGQVGFVLLGAAISIASFSGVDHPWLDSLVLTTPFWFILSFLFLTYERRLLAQLDEGV